MNMLKNRSALKNRNRKIESTVYFVLWLTVAVLYLLGAVRSRAEMSETLFDLKILKSFCSTVIPFFILFLVNNNILIPKMLLRNKFPQYFTFAALAMMLLWAYQFGVFLYEEPLYQPAAGAMPGPHRPPHISPFLPLPLFLDFMYAFLVVGSNLSVALLFQRFDDKLEKESLMKESAESQLKYLKAQINPHFYMNMLNNIHGMIEIDPEKAQRMVIALSQLMRYMLYDSSKPQVSLAETVGFLNNYVKMMRLRYPEDRVKISTEFPPEEKARTISIPPLLYLVFIENAFKHGISYRESSFVDVKLAIEDSKVIFNCKNTNHFNPEKDPSHVGIGLINIRKRLDLLFGEKAKLDISDENNIYSVTLTIPAHELENNNN